jgi:hypothetical protein
MENGDTFVQEVGGKTMRYRDWWIGFGDEKYSTQF